MGRRPAIREAGPMIQWSIRTTNRAREAIMAAAKARGVSVGIYLDQITHGGKILDAETAQALTHSDTQIHTGRPSSLDQDFNDEPATPAKAAKKTATRQKKRSPAEAETERQRIRREVAQAVIDKYPTSTPGDVPGLSADDCTHPLTESLTSGLRRCRACGATGGPNRFT